jgi:imidazolonepropionase-like amidohydrolase
MTTGNLLIRDGNVLDGTGSSVRRNCSVLVKNGIIVQLGEDAEAHSTSLKDISVIDARGKTVMPGLIDAHCHITYGNANSDQDMMANTTPEFGALRAAWSCGQVLSAGVTSLSEPNSLHNIGAALRDAVKSGMVEGPNIISAGAGIAPPYATGWGNWMRGYTGVTVVENLDEAVKAVRRQVNEGVDFIKIFGSAEAVTGNASLMAGELVAFSLRELQGMVEEAHRLGRKVAVHARAGQAVADAARAGADWIFHASFTTEAQLEVVAKSGAVVFPTLTLLANMGEWGHTVGVSAHLISLCQTELKAAAKILSQARKLGVPLAIGSEAGFSVTPYGEWHAREMELFVEHLGYSPMEAIVGMTRDNARILGFEKIGVIAQGMAGDVIVVNGDPLADIRIFQDRTRIVAVIRNGEPVDLARARRDRRPMPYEKFHPYATQQLTAEKVRPSAPTSAPGRRSKPEGITA